MRPVTPRRPLDELAALPPGALDAAVDAWLGPLAAPPEAAAPPGEHLIGHHASGAAAIVRALREAPVGPGDTFVDLGAGDGRVALLAHLLTGARAIGVELQPALVAAARAAAARLGVAHAVRFEHADARHAAAIDAGTVFYLYAPFTGPVLDAVLARLAAVAAARRLTVCALGVDLDHRAPWLRRRPLDDFWLAIHDAGP